MMPSSHDFSLSYNLSPSFSVHLSLESLPLCSLAPLRSLSPLQTLQSLPPSLQSFPTEEERSIEVERKKLKNALIRAGLRGS